MTDRIHPSNDADPSAPPLHGRSVAIPMPEKAVRKEQEVGLISQYEHSQTGRHDDHMYATQPPVYQTYGAQGYTGKSYALAPVHRRRPRRSPCCCCLLSFVVTLGTLILIAGIAALVVYLVVRPIRKPKYTIEGLDVQVFNVTNGVLKTQMELRVEAWNGNKKIGIGYGDIEVDVFYNDQEIGEGSIPGFYQGHRNTTLLTIPIEGHNISVTSATASAFESDADMWLEANARTRARIKIWRWKSPRHTFHVLCSLHLSSSPHPGTLTLLSSSCKLKKPKFYFLGIHF